MELTQTLLDAVAEEAQETPVCGVWVGLSWTIVASKYVGLAHTFKVPGRKVTLRDEGHLASGTVYDLMQRALDWEPLEASIGIAALNSMIRPRGTPGNVSAIIEQLVKHRSVAIIGRFPFNDRLSRRAATTYRLELDPLPGELPAQACESVLPRSDVVVITATTVINHTLGRLLELARDAVVVLLGPSTPVLPILFDRGVDILAGVEVTDQSELVDTVMQGAKTFRALDGIRPLNLFRPGFEQRFGTDDD